MTLAEIKNYRLYCSERDDIEEKLKNGKNKKSTVSILHRKSELIGKISDIKQFVDSIPEYKVRRAITIYCLEPIDENAKAPNWGDVACEIGHGCTESAIKKAVSRFFKV